MGTFAAALVLTFCLSSVDAGDKPNYGFWTAAQLQEIEKKLNTTMDDNKGSHEDLMPTTHSYFMMIHREATAPKAEVHQKHGDFGYVRAGEGVVITGGNFVNGTPAGPNEMRGALEGGIRHPLSVGDAFYIPAAMPHQFVIEPGKTLTVEMLKVERKDGFQDVPDLILNAKAHQMRTAKMLKGKMDHFYTANEDFIKNENIEMHQNHKEGSAESEIHQHFAEFQVILAGEGAMMLGGKVVNARTVDSNEIRGTALKGAVRQPLLPGDLIYIPPKTPHHTIVDRTKFQDKLIVKVWMP